MSSPVPYVLQDDYLSVIVDGLSYAMSKGQPTFKPLHQALTRKQWSKIPKLVSLANQIAEQSHGRVQVNSSGVFYKGQKIDNVLTAKILELIEHQKPVAHMLRFMDNLYQQKDMNTVNEIYQWLASGRFALTSDGCFLAYKKVTNDYKDIYTKTLDNRVGVERTMPRKAVNPDRHVLCSEGLHFCSRSYLPRFNGCTDARIMEVKVNPADVVAIPIDYDYAKGRTWRYEVVREVEEGEMVEGETDSPVMMQPVIEVAKERKALIRQVKALPSVKRLLRKGRMTPASFTKASTPRLVGWLRKFSRMDIAPAKSKLFNNPLRFAREAAGLTMGQVAKAAKISLSAVYNAERCQKPEQEVIDNILTVIAKLQGITYPEPRKPIDEVGYDEDEADDDGYENYDDYVTRTTRTKNTKTPMRTRTN